jgi:type II secretory pathway pseudopilin PulG
LRNLKNNLGFTVVEVMGALAIGAVLTTIAVIQYSKWANQTRQGEAKTNLASLAAAEKTFYTNYGHTTTQLDVVGFNPQGQVNYAYGYSGNYWPAPFPSPYPINEGTNCYATNIPTASLNCCYGNVCGATGAKWQNTNMVPTSAFPTPTTLSKWTGYAYANLTSRGADVWSIDSGDNLLNIHSSF